MIAIDSESGDRQRSDEVRMVTCSTRATTARCRPSVRGQDSKAHRLSCEGITSLDNRTTLLGSKVDCLDEAETRSRKGREDVTRPWKVVLKNGFGQLSWPGSTRIAVYAVGTSRDLLVQEE